LTKNDSERSMYMVNCTLSACIIFDMDGVLIDTMPFHAEAMRLAIKEETKHDINKKVVYLLEGLPCSELVKEISKKRKD
jgi:beta-phosphoglucomutase